MKAGRLILAIAIAATSAGAMAVPAAPSRSSDDTTVSRPDKWYEAGKFEQQDEVEKAKLESEGFPQYD